MAPYEQQMVLQMWVPVQLLQAKPQGTCWQSGPWEEDILIRELHLSAVLMVPANRISAKMNVSGACGWKFNMVLI